MCAFYLFHAAFLLGVIIKNGLSVLSFGAVNLICYV